MPKLILASASPRRIELLRQIGLEFTSIPSDVDESSYDFTDAGKYVEEMARRKALSVAQGLSGADRMDACVLGADTAVEIDGVILGKPVSYDDAFRMLETISGRWHRVYTGIALVRAEDLKTQTGLECTRVKIRDLDRDMISRYLETGEPFDKAGSYGAQGYGCLIVERVEGCFFNIVGLPIHRLSLMLEKQGFKVLSWLRPRFKSGSV